MEMIEAAVDYGNHPSARVPAAAPVAAVVVAAALFGLILVSNLLLFLGRAG